jgi:DNA-binding transcriptional MerR regulator
MERPGKLYYKIGEACKALDIQPYVLRYWETEFPSLNPTKSKSGQRVYTDREIEVIRRIKQLLYEEGYTIAGAKKKLETELASLLEPAAEAVEAAPAPPARKTRAKTTAEAAQNLALPLARPAAGKKSQAWRAAAERALRDAREILDLLDRPRRR